MGILNNIFSKIFPSAQAAVGHAKDAVKEQVDKITDTVKGNTSSNNTDSNTDQNQQNTSENKNPISEIDVMSILDNLAKKFPEKLNWKTSIVDLLKLLGIDNSLDARKKLATELNYTGSTDDTAAMNTWLIKEVMKKIAEKGGNVTHLFS
ncbi:MULTISPECIES: DUF3597 domain-containing protein [unclassified Gilliamella]|uniref:DUF3597 domain-containing protein n=1 Tax=unclassified Gilliamella TaxID=2685620 RepID=UPI00226A3353|nr:MULTISPECIES: DUF3597 domain-containing protein [unclassified Gilliamella]MCX8583959.1 DUF3597 domain-containing protein [Gilliamella sp. B3372]MCX8585481.1 DUF3597 domain-containing protein [Gilliamella sp. B3562]MCX8594626.1 DUF3597 domain-containing protein [Gilliamella sp. B3367]MCX8674203.1 DUF3597 domain-containing protein [Gilliamella sp. B3023]MCX8685392.1 DUF3597 domain-containing protein [Gilliamella sp. B2864]